MVFWRLVPSSRCIEGKASKLWRFRKNITHCLAHFLRTFEVGDAGRSCTGSDLADNQDDQLAQRPFTYSMRVVMGNPQHPHFPQADLYSLHNAAVTVIVKDDRCKKGKSKITSNTGSPHNSRLVAHRRTLTGQMQPTVERVEPM